MEVDKAPMGRTLRKRKGKVAKHLKREANEKEMEKRPEKLKRTLRRMFCEAREKMKNRITLKKKSDPGKFAVSCTVKDHLGLRVEPSKESFTFVYCSQRSSGGIVRDLESLLSTVGAVCNMQTNQLCLTLIDPHVYYNPIPAMKPQESSRRINDPGLIATCHCGAEYETKYSALIETHTTTLIDITHQKSIDITNQESDYDEDYKEERAIEYRAILDEEDRLLHHSSWKKNAPSIDRTVSTSIETHPYQTSQKRALTDIAYFQSIDTGVDHIREGDYLIGSWTDDHHHEIYAVETTVHEPGADELHEGFTYEELLNMQRRDEEDQYQAETCWERTRFSHPYSRVNRPSIDDKPTSLIDIRPRPPSTVSAKPQYYNQYQTQDEFDILQMANGAKNLFMQQRNSPTHQQRVTSEIYNTTGGVDDHFNQKSRQHTRPSIDVEWEEKDEYGVYKDDHGHAKDVDGHIINVSKEDIRSFLERASRDEHNYICLPEHASSFTQTKLVPEIYTKDEFNSMFYGVCGAQEKNEVYFQMNLDGVYYPLNDSISWSTTCMEEMRQDIAKIQIQRAAEATAPASIDRHHQKPINDDPQHSHPMKSQPDSYTRADIDQLVEGIYKTLETTEERLDRRCDDIYFPMDLTISSLTSKIEAIQREIVKIQGYIARRPEASTSIDRRNNKSTDSRR
ncbi:hypothetical protein F2Q70_00002962 [Brassica cretica]|uniref:Uncharacterized protein n=1 Tax=Brassica cretica TaxID=69181 RepID=A0A8S9IUL1_BRACR|nr:hypothetical protein F2Q70_00002962 [Brassica cretica]